MSHFAGIYVLNAPQTEAIGLAHGLRKEAAAMGWDGSWFEDGALHLLHVDFVTIRGDGFLNDQEAQVVTALAGELVLDNDRTGDFPRESDLTAFAHDVESSGISLLNRANGTFAVCRYQAQQRQLLLATDVLGARPLYYCLLNGLLVFSTSFRLLTRLPCTPRRTDFCAVAEEYAFGYTLDNRTLLRDVAILRDCECIVAVNGSWRLQRYHHWENTPLVDADFDTHLDRCHCAFQQAILNRATRSGSVYAMLSGGLDSRVIVAGLKQHGIEVEAINCANPGWQDHDYAVQFARKASVPVTQIAWSPEVVGLTSGQTTARLLTHILRDYRTQAVFSGDGGGETMGFLTPHPRVMDGGISAGIAYTTDGAGLPRRILRSTFSGRMCDWPYQAMREDLRHMSHLHPQKAFQQFMVRNDMRRHLHEFYEHIDNIGVELLLPFYDKRLVAAVLSIAPPLDRYLKHRLYHAWLARFPPAARAVPWQTYPGHEPCPLPDLGSCRSQWAMVSGAAAGVRRKWRNQAIRHVLSSSYPSDLLRRTPILMAAAASVAGASRYDYLFKACLNVIDAHRLSKPV